LLGYKKPATNATTADATNTTNTTADATNTTNATNTTVPESVDWTVKGAVNAVKN
jgi:hypothetical protein